MGNVMAAGKVDRILKNAAGEVLRIDTVSISGYQIRANTYVLRKTYTHPQQRDWGDWVFHSNGGRKVSTELFYLGGARVIGEIEMIGLVPSLDTTNFDWFDIATGSGTYRVDMTDLPNVGDTV